MAADAHVSRLLERCGWHRINRLGTQSSFLDLCRYVNGLFITHASGVYVFAMWFVVCVSLIATNTHRSVKFIDPYWALTHTELRHLCFSSLSRLSPAGTTELSSTFSAGCIHLLPAAPMPLHSAYPSLKDNGLTMQHVRGDAEPVP